MIQRRALISLRQLASSSEYTTVRIASRCTVAKLNAPTYLTARPSTLPRQPCSAFHTSRACFASAQTADAVMENLTELYLTAKDEFEIAAEETEKKTVYAADDREAAKEAFNTLKEAYEKAVRESDPQTTQEVQRRTGPRIRELENALTAVEEMAMED